LIYGVGDFSASQGIDLGAVYGPSGYPGDIWHYGRQKITIAARAAGIDAVDGPFGNFKDAATCATGRDRRRRRASVIGSADERRFASRTEPSPEYAVQ
jgi:citrate lyase subunit beta / citryl-CoA lyase